MRIRKQNLGFEEKELLFSAKVGDALAHPLRIEILKLITDKNQKRIPVCNKDLVEHFGYAQATISQHVNKLVQADLVKLRMENKFSIYYANIGIIGKYMDTLKKIII